MVDGVRSGNIALLIDADNASCAGFEDVLAILAELGTVNVRRAYGNWEKPGLKGWKALTPSFSSPPPACASRWRWWRVIARQLMGKAGGKPR